MVHAGLAYLQCRCMFVCCDSGPEGKAWCMTGLAHLQCRCMFVWCDNGLGAKHDA